MHVRLSRVPVAVAVHRKTVHDIDIQDIPIQVIHNRFSCLRHGLQKSVLVSAPHAAAGAAAVDMGLSLRGSNTDGNIFYSAAVPCHGMALEVREHYIVIIVRKMAAHIVFFQISASRHRQRHGALLVHDVHIRYLRIAVVFRHLIVHGRADPGTTVCCVALHDGRIIKGLHQNPDQVCPQIIAARLPCGELDRKLSLRGSLKGLIDGDQSI